MFAPRRTCLLLCVNCCGFPRPGDMTLYRHVDALLMLEKDVPENGLAILSAALTSMRLWCTSGAAVAVTFRLLQDRVFLPGWEALVGVPELQV